MAVYENSRYLHTRLFNRLGWDTPTLEMRKRFTFNQENYSTHEWCEGDTLEFDIKNGDIILIPDYEEVVSLVNV